MPSARHPVVPWRSTVPLPHRTEEEGPLAAEPPGDPECDAAKTIESELWTAQATIPVLRHPRLEPEEAPLDIAKLEPVQRAPELLESGSHGGVPESNNTDSSLVRHSHLSLVCLPVSSFIIGRRG